MAPFPPRLSGQNPGPPSPPLPPHPTVWPSSSPLGSAFERGPESDAPAQAPMAGSQTQPSVPSPRGCGGPRPSLLPSTLSAPPLGLQASLTQVPSHWTGGPSLRPRLPRGPPITAPQRAAHCSLSLPPVSALGQWPWEHPLPAGPAPSRPQRRHVAEGRHVGERGAHEWVLRPRPLSCRSFPIREAGPDSAAPATPRAPGTWKLLSLLPGVAFPPLGRADGPVSRWRDQGPEKGGAGLGPKHPREPLSHAKPGTSSAHS